MQKKSNQQLVSQSRAIQIDSFGGVDKLRLAEVPQPAPGPGQLRVKVSAAGLNPMDWFMTADAETAKRFGLSLPCGFGTDYSGVVDAVGDEVSKFAPGQRVFGSAFSRAVADYLIVDANCKVAASEVYHTPAGVDDRTAAAITIAGRTASAALSVIGLNSTDTVLIGGAAGGVGIFAVQLARIAGARVLGTAAVSSAQFVRDLGAEHVSYGEGLVERVRELVPDGITAAIDLFGTETAAAARELGISDKRITTIAAQVDGITPANGANATAEELEKIANFIATGQLRVPIAKVFSIAQVREAVTLQAGRHVKGKIVIDLS